MSESQYLRETIDSGEHPGVEFKGPGRCEGQLRAQVVRAVLGMSNRRDGGVVIIGVDAAPGRLKPLGISPPDLASWEADLVQDAIAPYADPSVSIRVRQEILDAKTYVIIRVEEFTDVPVLCRKSYGTTLSEGALYVRARRKPETTVVRTAADMRDLLEIAIEKRLRSYVATAERARLRLTSDSFNPDAARFANQVDAL